MMKILVKESGERIADIAESYSQLLKDQRRHNPHCSIENPEKRITNRRKLAHLETAAGETGSGSGTTTGNGGAPAVRWQFLVLLLFCNCIGKCPPSICYRKGYSI